MYTEIFESLKNLRKINNLENTPKISEMYHKLKASNFWNRTENSINASRTFETLWWTF